MASGADVVREAYDAFGRGDIPAVLEATADDVEWTVADVLVQGGSWQGREAVGQFFQALGEHYEELSIDVQDLVDGGEHVVGVGVGHGKRRGGGPVEYGFAHVFTVSDGKVTRFREYADRAVD
jgi:ketosteroid isomerase-like protein